MKKIIALAAASTMVAAPLALLPTAANAAEVSCTPTTWRVMEKAGGWRLDMSVPPPGEKVYADQIQARVQYTCGSESEFRWFGLSTTNEADYFFVFPANQSGQPDDYIGITKEQQEEFLTSTYWNSGSTSTYCEVGTTWYGEPFCTGLMTGQIGHASAVISSSIPPRTDHLDLFPVRSKTIADPIVTPEPVVTPPAPVVTAPVVTAPTPTVSAPAQKIRAWSYSKQRKIKVNVDPNGHRYWVQLQKRTKSGGWKDYGTVKQTVGTKTTFNPRKGTYQVHVLGWGESVAYSQPIEIKS